MTIRQFFVHLEGDSHSKEELRWILTGKEELAGSDTRNSLVRLILRDMTLKGFRDLKDLGIFESKELTGIKGPW